MSNINYTRIILGSLRYKSAPDTDLGLKIPLVQNLKELVEYDRTIDISLEQLYDDERQKSDVLRPSAKFAILFKNSYVGTANNYTPFENNMYYINEQNAAAAGCAQGALAAWTGYPQFHEFDFIRTDYNVIGYTQPPSQHITFIPQSASSYNWNFFVSYPYENDYTKVMTAIDVSGQTLAWNVSDGIPFIITRTNNGVPLTYNGRNIIQFRCPVKHGLSVGESVLLDNNFIYNGNKIFEVYSLGDNYSVTDEYIFNLIDVGYTGTTFNDGASGTFKRVILRGQTADTISEYYVRKHKILTNVENAVVTKAGFEENIFGNRRKFESSGFTPNRTARISLKEGAQSYTLSFNKDILVNPLLDNQKRPISELFFTIIFKGFFGWFYGRAGQTTGYGLKQGWEFNLQPVSSTTPQPWWDFNNANSDVPIPLVTLSSPPLPIPPQPQNNFYHLSALTEGQTIDGDYCEWNNFTQEERVISKLHHKLRFNSTHFTIPNINYGNPLGYYYQPHWGIKTRVFSDYIEQEPAQSIFGVPNYAYYSTTNSTFRWRDVYPYGFVDTAGLGINYPFLNGAHYPFENYFFRIIPEGTNYIQQTIIQQPVIDNCE